MFPMLRGTSSLMYVDKQQHPCEGYLDIFARLLQISPNVLSCIPSYLSFIDAAFSSPTLRVVPVVHGESFFVFVPVLDL
jgi:hypothetical protein